MITDLKMGVEKIFNSVNSTTHGLLCLEIIKLRDKCDTEELKEVAYFLDLALHEGIRSITINK